MSLVNSTIDEYVLASFALPQTAPASATTRSSSSSFAPPTTSVQYPHALRQDGRLVVATPGVGVSIYDVSPLSSLSSLISLSSPSADGFVTARGSNPTVFDHGRTFVRPDHVGRRAFGRAHVVGIDPGQELEADLGRRQDPRRHGRDLVLARRRTQRRQLGE